MHQFLVLYYKKAIADGDLRLGYTAVTAAIKMDPHLYNTIMRHIILTLLLGIGMLGCSSDDQNTIPEDAIAPLDAEMQYLAFQFFATSTNEPMGDYGPLPPLVPKSQLEDFMKTLKNKVGVEEHPRRKLSVMIGPLALDHSDEAITQAIVEAFDLALKYDIAIGFHLDDGMYWASREDLWSDPENIEWADWQGTFSESRNVDWIQKRLGPHMCFNAPKVLTAMESFMDNIAEAINQGRSVLKIENRETLFAGVIVGWETSLDKEWGTEAQLGYHALINRGFSESNPPADLDEERIKIVQDFMNFLAEPLMSSGIPKEKVYAHIAFLSKIKYDEFEKINPALDSISYHQINGFATPEIISALNFQPGFTTYPNEGVLEQLHALENGTLSGWASSEGTNIILQDPPLASGFSMEWYLARHYNYGANLVNIFSFGLGGIDPFNDAVNEATENEEALIAYKKFLEGKKLRE